MITGSYSEILPTQNKIIIGSYSEIYKNDNYIIYGNKSNFTFDGTKGGLITNKGILIGDYKLIKIN